MTGAELVGPLPTVVFDGGPDRRWKRERPTVAYKPPRDTMDLRYVQCTEHRVACDCREAEFAEERREQRGLWDELHRTAWSVLAGHQIEQPMTSLWADERDERGLCLCSGCVIYRHGHRDLLPWRAVDHHTGRVHPFPAA